VFDTTQISDAGIVRHLREIAAARGMPSQLEVLNHGGTDASLIQRLRAGVAVVTLSVPARYIHTVNETVAVPDVEWSVDLLSGWLAEAHTRKYGAGVQDRQHGDRSAPRAIV
jgi:endoglucanase